jgi:hypothetical protein
MMVSFSFWIEAEEERRALRNFAGHDFTKLYQAVAGCFTSNSLVTEFFPPICFGTWV